MIDARIIIGRAIFTMLLASAAEGIGQTPAALQWPEPFIAPDARLSSVGDHININGVPARILRYTSRRSPDDVIRYFREHTQRDVSAVQRSSILPGQAAIAGRVGDYWVTLQVKEQGGETVGTWSAVPQFVPNVAVRVHRPAGFPASAQLIQQVDSFDEDKRSELAVGIDPSPVDGVAERLNEELREQGFVREPMPATPPSSDTYVTLYRKGREEILATLKQEQHGTTVSINRIYALEELK